MTALPDAVDACPDSDLRPTVVIGDCDSGVENDLLDDSCTIADLVAVCFAEDATPADATVCVVMLGIELGQAGIITSEERGRLSECAARSALP